jgi:hypothetical protein
MASAVEEQPASPSGPEEHPGFIARGRIRRRVRFLRKARELAYRDLGGLVFNLHRFGQRNDALVLAKLTTLGHIDTELRALEGMLGESRPVTVLREAGITACPRCAAIHSSQDNFCPNCGFTMRRHADLPIAAPAPTGVPAQTGAPAPASVPAQTGAPAPASVPAQTGAPAPASVPAQTGAPAPASVPAQTGVPATGQVPTPAAAPAPTPDSASVRPQEPARTPSPVGSDEEDGPTEIISPPAPGS